MRYLLSLISLFFVIVLYQNCAEPIRDLDTNRSEGACLESPQTVDIVHNSLGNNEYRFSLGISQDQVKRIAWAINGQPQQTSSSSTVKDFLLDDPNIHNIQARVFSPGCDNIQFIASTSVDTTQGQCNNSEIQITTSNNLIQTNENQSIDLVNQEQLENNSIVWYLDGQVVANADPSYNFSQSATGNYIVKAKAKRSANPSTCPAIDSNEITMEVTNNNPSVDTNVTLNLTPEICSVDIVGTYQCSITANISNISNLDPNHSIRIHAGNVDANNYTGTTILCYSSSYTQTSQSMSWIPTTGRDIGVFVDTSGNSCQTYSSDTEKQNYIDNHRVSLNKKKLALAKCGTNLYTDARDCLAVGDGYYSANKNNNRHLCSLPLNAVATGPGLNGEDNCPWSCQSGFVKDGNQCVEGSDNPCPGGHQDDAGNCHYCSDTQYWNDTSGECVDFPDCFDGTGVNPEIQCN